MADSADKGAELSGEQRLIKDLFAPLSNGVPGAFALTDDAAVIAPGPGEEIVVTVDTVIEGRHYLPSDPLPGVAAKALRVNLSDLAAKGAEARFYLLSLAIPDHWGMEGVAAFAGGLKEDQTRYGVALLGGDTTRTPGPAVISITAFGAVPTGRMVRRAGAKPGEWVYVSGTIGDAVLGLELLQGDPPWRAGLSDQQIGLLCARNRRPDPPMALAPALRAHVSAAMDISDGLAGDLAQICRVSGVSARVEAARVPLSDAARAAIDQSPELIETILTGGDDYQVLCTLAPDKARAFEADAESAGIVVTMIGEIGQGADAPVFLGEDGDPLAFERLSFSHI